MKGSAFKHRLLFHRCAIHFCLSSQNTEVFSIGPIHITVLSYNLNLFQGNKVNKTANVLYKFCLRSLRTPVPKGKIYSVFHCPPRRKSITSSHLLEKNRASEVNEKQPYCHAEFWAPFSACQYEAKCTFERRRHTGMTTIWTCKDFFGIPGESLHPGIVRLLLMVGIMKRSMTRKLHQSVFSWINPYFLKVTKYL